MTAFILNIEDPVQAADAGLKACHLHEISQFGLSVPKTYFLSVKAYRLFIEHNKLNKSIAALIDAKTTSGDSEIAGRIKQLQRQFAEAEFPAGIRDAVSEICAALKSIGIDQVAVRSSGTLEDTAERSFAGQFETVLNVPVQADHVIKAIRRVWASQWNEKFVAYTSLKTLTDLNPAMGVIIQQMLQPEIAGVLFSINPQNGDDSQLLIEYVAGTGDSLVSGEQTPSQIAYNKTDKKFGSGTEPDAQWPTHINDLIEQSLKLESALGYPVDVEWALADNQIYFLQLRPITVEAQPAILWTDENVGEVIPDIVTPLSWDILEPMTNNAFRWFLKQSGIRDYPSQGLFGLYKGKVYFNNTAFNKTLQRFYISEIFKDSGQDKKSFLAKIAILFKTSASLINVAVHFGWFSLTLPGKIKKHLTDHPRRLDGLMFEQYQENETALDKIRQIIALHHRTMALHIACTINGEISYQLLKKLCSRWLMEKSAINADDLLTGLDQADSARSGIALWELTRQIHGDSATKKLFLENNPEQIEKHLTDHPADYPVSENIDRFFNEYGHGSLNEFELYYPRWREDKSYIFNTIKNYLKNLDDVNPVAVKTQMAEQRNESTKQAFAALNTLQRMFFKPVLKRARFFSSERENLKQALIRAHNELKKHLLFLGDQLTNDSQIAASGDILFLQKKELYNYFEKSKNDLNYKSLIETRKIRRQQFVSEAHPSRIRQIGDNWYPVDPDKDKMAGDLEGIPCSGGSAEGSARVIISADDFDTLQKGEVLVTRSTNPGWTPLFVLAAAVVTEIGGALSHGAIIAREYGIPMIAAAAEATTKIKTGMRIRVDGSTGVIEILNH